MWSPTAGYDRVLGVVADRNFADSKAFDNNRRAFDKAADWIVVPVTLPADPRTLKRKARK